MAINIAQGFKVNSQQPIDTRIFLTKSDMVATNDSLQPQVYFAVCIDDGQMYIYNKANAADPATGKFRVLQGGGGSVDLVVRGYYYNGSFYAEAAHTTLLVPDAAKIYVNLEVAEMGAIYTYDAVGSQYVAAVPMASASVAGKAKLYSGAGTETDGSCTRASITAGFESIGLGLDPDEPDCLVVTKSF